MQKHKNTCCGATDQTGFQQEIDVVLRSQNPKDHLLTGNQNVISESLDLLADRGGSIGTAKIVKLVVDDANDGIRATDAAEFLRPAAVESIPHVATSAAVAAYLSNPCTVVSA